MTSISTIMNRDGESSSFSERNETCEFRAPVREGYTYIDSTNPIARGIAPIERISPTDKSPREGTMNNWAEAGYQDAGSPHPQNPVNAVNGTYKNPDQPLTMRSINRTLPKPNSAGSYNGVNPRPGCTPVTDLLLPETSTMVYTDEFFQQPNANLFLQNIQPNIYSYAVDTTPINALASGISYTPQVPPRFRDQVYNNHEGLTYPIYTRVDPQLIRDQGVPARLLEQPVRGNWSDKYSNWEAAPGSVNYEDIYDGRFSGYGDPYRAYSDVNLGQVQYYVSDLDAYRYPNFVTRNKVDFIEFTNPMGKITPHYQRTAGLNDSRPFVENQWLSDSNYFRESIMESNMRPANARSWQYRFAPLSRASHSNFKAGPT
jgi:hypothetical protein